MARGSTRVRLAVAATLAAGSLTFFGSGLGSPASAAPTLVDPVTPLPGQPTTVNSVAVDDASSQVFTSFVNILVVTGLDGASPQTISGLHSAGDIAVDPSIGKAYVAQPGWPNLAEVDTSTHTLTQIDMPEGWCAESVAYSGSKIWISAIGCTNTGPHFGKRGFGSYDPSDGTFALTVNTNNGIDSIVALPGHPDRVLMWDQFGGDPAQVWDTTTSTSVPASSLALPSGCGAGALLGAGASAAFACGISMTHVPVWTIPGFVSTTAVGPTETARHLAVSPDGKFLASSTDGAGATDIFITDISAGGAGTPVRQYSLSACGGIQAMAWSASGRLYAVGSTCQAPYMYLHVLDAANTIAPVAETLSLSAPVSVRYGAAIHLIGKLTPAPGHAVTASLSRTTRLGTTALGTVTIASDGTYSASSVPGTTGKVTYNVSFAGDATHSAAAAQTDVMNKPLAYDIKGNGYAALVVGTSFEDVGTVKDAGDFTVLYSGASGPAATGSVSYTQDTTGVPGVVEANDNFGWGQVSGDFNGDGFADVAVSSENEGVGSVAGAGTVTVFYGSVAGLKTTGVQLLQAPVPVKGGQFGTSMAVGDFNGDGVDDLAIGQPGTNEVDVSLGSASAGLTSALQILVPADGDEGLAFGESLATGDVNGDGRSDLAVGAPDDYADLGYSTGAVSIFFGAASGLSGSVPNQVFTKNSPGVPGDAAPFTPGKDISDEFGLQVVLGDFNGDGKADLAVAAPGSPVTTSDSVKHEDAGTVTVLYSDGGGINTTNAIEVTQSTSGMPGSPGKGDEMGYTLAAGDENADGSADLAIFSAGDRYVTIVKGGVGGLQYASAMAFTQSSSGVYGTDTVGDFWGDSLRFENFEGAGAQGLMVGADGKHSGKGSVTVLYSTAGALTGTGSTYLDQDSTGVPGTGETGDGFGSSFFTN